MAIYRFKVSFEDYDDVIREIDIHSYQTFQDLHLAIHRSTGYAPEKSSSFYVSSDQWVKKDEITYLPNQRKIDAGIPIMEKVKLSKFIDDPHQKFYYIYNFDRPIEFHVELIKILLEAESGKEYPYVVRSFGEAPKIVAETLLPVASSSAMAGEFDFLNDIDFNPQDAEEIESMNEMGINTADGTDTDQNENEEEMDEFSDQTDYDHEDERDY